MSLPLHQVSEQVYDLLLQSRPVLDDGVSFVGHLLLKLLQLLDLLTDLELGLSQRRDPGWKSDKVRGDTSPASDGGENWRSSRDRESPVCSDTQKYVIRFN